MDDQTRISGGRLLELRHYHIAEGRRDDFNRRFATVAVPLFEKLGMRASRLWEEAGDQRSLWYTIAWDSVEQMRATWVTFAADPLWLSAKPEFEASGNPVDRVESTVLIGPEDTPLRPTDGLWVQTASGAGDAPGAGL